MESTFSNPSTTSTDWVTRQTPPSATDVESLAMGVTVGILGAIIGLLIIVYIYKRRCQGRPGHAQQKPQESIRDTAATVTTMVNAGGLRELSNNEVSASKELNVREIMTSEEILMQDMLQYCENCA